MALQLPATFTPTHDTDGLAGYPAVDVFASAGTGVLAPASGTLTNVHLIPWDTVKRIGGYTAYLVTSAGTYFLTHLGSVLPEGSKVTAGQQIGTVGAVPGNAWAPHVHEGLNTAAKVVAAAVSSTVTDITAALKRIVSGATSRNLDPGALLAVAKAEGLSGAVGDNGTSFGPFQLHIGGQLPATVANKGADYAQQWAWSDEGIDYALNQIAKVAQGQRGPTAIKSIVSRFESPADPQSEISKATGYYTDASKAATTIASAGDLLGSGNSFFDDIGNAITAPFDTAKDVADAVANIGGSIATFVSKIFDPSFWLRALQVLGGGALVGGGLFLLARQVGLAVPTPKPPVIPIPVPV